MTSDDRRCPRTGRVRAPAPGPDQVRPSDMLVAFFACAVALLAVATALGVAGVLTGEEDLRWLALHLALLGGVSQLVLGAAQFFVCAFLATDPPPRRILRAQLLLWNAGTAAIAVGVTAGVTALGAVGGTAILAGLALFAAALKGMQRRSLQTAPWAARWYLAGAGFLAAGAILGPLMAAEVAWAQGSLLAAHLALNIGGWFGSAIVGTLHTFYPSLTGTRLRWPALQRPAFGAWCTGVTAVALGGGFASAALSLAGWLSLLVGGLALAVNLAASALTARRQTPAGLIVGAAQLVLPAALLAGVVLTIDGGATAALTGPGREIVAILALGGWIGLTVLGSLVHLLGLMAGVRASARPPRPAELRRRHVVLAFTAVLAVDALTTGRALGVDPLAIAGAVALAAVYVWLGGHVLTDAVRAVRAAPVRV